MFECGNVKVIVVLMLKNSLIKGDIITLPNNTKEAHLSNLSTNNNNFNRQKSNLFTYNIFPYPPGSLSTPNATSKHTSSSALSCNHHVRSPIQKTR